MRAATLFLQDRHRRCAVNQPRTLARSVDDRMLAGVVGGIARRMGWNATLLRVIFVIASIASVAFPGILVYLILWLLMPNETP